MGEAEPVSASRQEHEVSSRVGQLFYTSWAQPLGLIILGWNAWALQPRDLAQVTLEPSTKTTWVTFGSHVVSCFFARDFAASTKWLSLLSTEGVPRGDPQQSAFS